MREHSLRVGWGYNDSFTGLSSFNARNMFLPEFLYDGQAALLKQKMQEQCQGKTRSVSPNSMREDNLRKFLRSFSYNGSEWYAHCNSESSYEMIFYMGDKMKSSHRRIIKSEEVNYTEQPEKPKAETSICPDHLKKTGQTVNALDRLKETFASKLQLAEQDAYSRGLSDGIRQGKEFQKNESLQTLKAMAAIVADVSALKKNILMGAEEQMIRLTFAIAEKVLQLEVTVNRDVIQSVLKEAIKNIVDREHMKIRIHPDDFHYMMEIKSDFLQNFDGIKNIVFESDSSIGRGGAIIETLFGEVDARIDQQYQELKKMMIPKEQG